MSGLRCGRCVAVAAPSADRAPTYRDGQTEVSTVYGLTYLCAVLLRVEEVHRKRAGDGGRSAWALVREQAPTGVLDVPRMTAVTGSFLASANERMAGGEGGPELRERWGSEASQDESERERERGRGRGRGRELDQKRDEKWVDSSTNAALLEYEGSARDEERAEPASRQFARDGMEARSEKRASSAGQ